MRRLGSASLSSPLGGFSSGEHSFYKTLYLSQASFPLILLPLGLFG